MYGSCRVALPIVWEALPVVLEWSSGPPGCPRVVGRPCRMSGSGRRPSQMSRSGLVALPDVREWSGNPPRCPEDPLG